MHGRRRAGGGRSRRTTTLNAYVSGFGSTRRVVLYDNLVDDVRRGRPSSVVAHELGHARHHDVLVGTVLGAVGVAWAAACSACCCSRRLLGRSAVVGPGTRGGGVGAGAGRRRVSAGEPGGEHGQPRGRGTRGPGVAGGDRRTMAAFERMQGQLAIRSLSGHDPPAGASSGSGRTRRRCSGSGWLSSWGEAPGASPTSGSCQGQVAAMSTARCR